MVGCNRRRAKILKRYKDSSEEVWRSIIQAAATGATPPSGSSSSGGGGGGGGQHGSSRHSSSAAVFEIICEWTSSFAGAQICWDLGYKHGELYDEDAHEYIGGTDGEGALGGLQTVFPGLRPDGTAEFGRMRQLQAALAPRMPPGLLRGPVTLQTVEVILCEYRKFVRNTKARKKNRRGRGSASAAYKLQHARAWTALDSWRSKKPQRPLEA